VALVKKRTFGGFHSVDFRLKFDSNRNRLGKVLLAPYWASSRLKAATVALIRGLVEKSQH